MYSYAIHLVLYGTNNCYYRLLLVFSCRRASGDGGLGELLKLEPIKECSHSPPKVKQSATSTSLPIFSSSSSSLLSPNSSPSKETADSITCSSGVRNEAVIKSPTRALAGQLSRNLSIKSPLLSSSSQSEPKLTALPKHMQVQGRAAGSKVCKTSSLLTSAMRFHSGNDGLNSILDGSPDPIPGKCTCTCRHTVYTCMWVHCVHVQCTCGLLLLLPKEYTTCMLCIEMITLKTASTCGYMYVVHDLLYIHACTH